MPSSPVWSIEVRGDPKGQPRPRAFARGGKARVYDPGTAEGWKSLIAVAAKARGIVTVEGPISVGMTFWLRRPKAHYRRVRGEDRSVLRDDVPTWHSSKPDLDNLVKAVMDTLTTIGMWQDDALVAVVDAEKRWANWPADCGALIEVWRIGKDRDRDEGGTP